MRRAPLSGHTSVAATARRPPAVESLLLAARSGDTRARFSRPLDQERDCARRSLRSLGARCAHSALAAAQRSLPLGARCRSALPALGARCARSARAALTRRSLRSLGARYARSTLATLAQRTLRSLGARCARLALAGARRSLPLGARCSSALSALGAFCARRSLRSLGARCAHTASLRSLGARSFGARYARSALAALARRSSLPSGIRINMTISVKKR